jgi:cell division protein FtsA
VGAANVTKDLAAGLRISLESAEILKIFMGKDKTKEDEVDISSLKLPEEIKTVSKKTLVEGIIRPRLNEMFQLIAGEVKKSDLAGLTPSGLVITGGGAMTVGLIDSAKRVMGMPVRLGTPNDLSGLVDEVDNPAFAVSVGLIKYARKTMEESDGGSPINFSRIEKIPGSGMVGKIGNWVKSLLP